MSRKLTCLLFVACVVMAPGVASAHAVLLQTTPTDGATLDTAPGELRLTFSEPVRPIFLRLINSDGQQLLDSAAIHGHGSAITATLPPLDNDAYVVSWRVVSVDGHPIGGAFTFRIGADAAAAVSAHALPNTQTAWLAASVISRFLVYALTLLTAGGALFIVFVLGRRALPVAIRRYLLCCCGTAAIALIASVGIEGGLLALGPWTTIFDPSVWLLAASGSVGASVLVSLLGVALVAASVWRRIMPRYALALLGACVATAGFGLTGHAATASPRWLTTPTVIVHALTAAFWVGSLWPLLWYLRHRQASASAGIMHRFSRLAVISVALLVLAGVILAIVQLASVTALWQTRYGLILVAKLIAVIALLGLAATNKLRLTPALHAHATTAGRKLGRSMRTEIGLVVVILAASAALGTVPPPRALAAQQHSAHQHSHADTIVATASSYTARIEVSPARAGTNTITVHLRRDDGSPVQPMQATLTLSLPARGIEAMSRTLTPIRPGVLRYSGPIPISGQWTLRIKLLVSAFKRVIFTAQVRIR